MLQGIPGLMISRPAVPVIAGITQVQVAQYASTTNPATHTIGATQGWAAPVAGNVLIMAVVCDSTVSTPAGWTLGNSAVDFSGTYIFWKVSAGTETSISLTAGGAASMCIGLMEYDNLTTIDKTANAIGQGTTTVGTGTTAATTAADELIVVVAGVSNGGTTPPTVSSWNNSLVSQVSVQASGVGVPITLDLAVKIVAATGTQSGTATLSATGTAHNSGIICTFK